MRLGDGGRETSPAARLHGEDALVLVDEECGDAGAPSGEERDGLAELAHVGRGFFLFTQEPLPRHELNVRQFEFGHSFTISENVGGKNAAESDALSL